VLLNIEANQTYVQKVSTFKFFAK